MNKQDVYFLPFVKAIPDKLFLRLHFLISCKKILHLKNPVTYNEKIQWIKLYDHNPLYTKLVDKYDVKSYVEKLIGKKYIIPTYGVWDSVDDINPDFLPDSFVLKCTHDSGGVVICRDKSDFDFEEAKKILSDSLKKNYYYCGREWAYKNVTPRIIAEKYMVDESGYELKDYKVFCFNGEPRIIQVDYNRFSGHLRNLYTDDWEYIHGTSKFPTNPEKQFKKPPVLDELLSLSRTLSKDIPQVRVDFYIVENQIYFGELTLYHGSGFEKYTPSKLGTELGNMLILPERN